MKYIVTLLGVMMVAGACSRGNQEQIDMLNERIGELEMRVDTLSDELEKQREAASASTTASERRRPWSGFDRKESDAKARKSPPASMRDRDEEHGEDDADRVCRSECRVARRLCMEELHTLGGDQDPKERMAMRMRCVKEERQCREYCE